MGKLPPKKNGNRILIICEGSEENDYITRLKECKVWNSNYSILPKNAKSIDNISAVFGYNYRSTNYDAIFIFCDTEKAPYEKFLKLHNAIGSIIGDRKQVSNVVYFSNPCTMQIVLSHFGEVSLKSNDKSVNAPLIKSLTGVVDYKATENQRMNMMKKINSENYRVMKNNIAKLPKDHTNVPSTNCLELFNKLENV